jgi:hypothetical protein
VRLYGQTADTIDYGYTPGYLGSYVSNNTVVYGSGWYYRPWIGYHWYGSPWTWGHGFSFYYSWWYPSPYYSYYYPYYPYYAYYPYYPVYWRPYPCYRPWWGAWAPTHPVPVRAAPRPHPIRGTIAEQYGGNPLALSGGGVYSRWGREIARQVAPPAAPVTSAGARSERLPSGTGYIIRDGRRFDFTDRAINRGIQSAMPGIPATRALPDGAVGRNAARVFDRTPQQAQSARDQAFVQDGARQIAPRGPIGRTAEQVMRDRRDPVPRERWTGTRPGRAEVRTVPQRSTPSAGAAAPSIGNDGAVSRAFRSVMPPAPRVEQRQAIPERRVVPRSQIDRALTRPQLEPRAMPRPQAPPRAVQARPAQPRAQPQPPSGGGAVQRGVGRAFGGQR